MSRLVADWLDVHARSQPDLEAVHDVGTSWSFAQLHVASGALAEALAAEGIMRGDRIATLLEDDAAAVSLIHAVRRLGAVLVPLNRRSEAAELGYQLVAAGAGLLVHDERHQTLSLAAAKVAAADVAAQAQDVAQGSATVALVTMGRLQGCAAEANGHESRAQLDLDAPATILFTSGTTARPKAVVLTHGNHVASADAWAILLRPRASDRWLVCLPLFHVAGQAMVTRASRWGVPLEVHDRFDAAAVDAAIEAGVSHLSLVPALLAQLIAVRAARPTPPTLRAILLGGGPLPTSLLAGAAALGLPVITTYGMTETASGLAAGGAVILPHAAPGALRPLSGAQLQVQPDSSEILVRGPMVFDRYLHDEADSSAIQREGWFATGDIGHLDADGLLHVSNRRADLVISGGENISPAEVEAVLTAHPGISEAAVLGRADRRWGEVPVAVIVVAPGAMVSDATLAAHCRERLARFKVPVAFHRRRTLPRNAAGKILRSELRKSLREESD
ncbi:MAG: o-succinylbenzoate--CoA ligase [Chloroflexota bacterium]